MAEILEGKSIRDDIRSKLKKKIDDLIEKGKNRPTLVIVQIGNNSESNTYIKMKKQFGESIGAEVLHKRYPEAISERELIEEVELLNRDRAVSGMIVQFPLPPQLDRFKIIEAIDPGKDADMLHSKNSAVGKMPATTRGVMTLLDHYEINIEGKNVLVIGRSELVGIPTARAFLKRGATVTIAHSKTKNLEEHCLRSDIIVSAVGKPKLITKNMAKESHIMIDIGITSTGDGIVGDVDFEEVSAVADKITPVPGGIGPLTVASLFENLLDLFEESDR